MPQWLEKLLGSDFFLNMAASFSGSTSTEGLEEMTLSMINGEGAAFNQQADMLVDWIENQERPDVVHLSSSLVIGIAKSIKQKVAVPVVCSLQDEEVWIDNLRRGYAAKAWNGILENTNYVDRFVASSEFYKEMITHRFPLITNVEVVYPGVNRAKYASETYPDDPVIGFFYRMNEENGLGILAKAFVKLKKTGRFDRVRLRIGGGYTSTNKKFLKHVRKILLPYSSYVDWCDTYSLDDHAKFYREITAICVPITFDEGVGLYLCEAFAAGRPAIEPATGSFNEIVGNAGILYSPNSSDTLADAMDKLLSEDGLWDQCRANAEQLSRTRYNETTQANELYSIYKSLCPTEQG